MMFRPAIISVFILMFAASAWAQPGSSPSRLSGLSAFNPEISLNGLFAAGYFSESDNLNFGGHDPSETGFIIQNLELAIGAGVDPFFRADAFIIYLIEDGESVVEVEEAFFTTLGDLLPWLHLYRPRYLETIPDCSHDIPGLLAITNQINV